jgi:hypothetical protein
MAKKGAVDLVVEQKILNKIYAVRGNKLILDKDLAIIYGIETKVFNYHVVQYPQ